MYLHCKDIESCISIQSFINASDFYFLNISTLVSFKTEKVPLEFNCFDPDLFIGELLYQSTLSRQIAYRAQTMTIREELVEVGFNTGPSDLM